MTSRPGITLIELMISLVLLMGITLVMINVFIATSRFTADETNRLQVGETAARALATLDDTLREGRQVLSQGDIGGTTYTTDSTTLVVGLPSIVGGVLTDANDTVVIRLNAATHNLQQLTAPATGSSRSARTVQLATGVSDVYFRYTTNDPSLSTDVTTVIASSATTSAQTFTRTTLLYETLRNHQ